MLVYLVVFATSAMLFAISDKTKNKKLSYILIAIALLIPCVLAGLRAENIGTDVTVYVKQLYEASKNSSNFSDYFGASWFAIWKYKYVADFEIGFTILVYIVTKVFGSLNAVLFAISALIILPIFFRLYSYRNRQPVWLGMLVFYLLYYNEGLNMMRQWIAMAIIIFAFEYLNTKRYMKYAVLIAIASTFHVSAIIGVAIAIVYCFIQPDNNLVLKIRNKFYTNVEMKAIFIFGIACLAIIALPLVIRLMHIVGLGTYDVYINGTISLLPMQIILRMPIIFLYIFNWKSFKLHCHKAPFYMSMVLLDVVISQLISINMFAFRIATFFAMYNILGLPALITSKTKKTNRILMATIVICYLVIYWFYFTVIKGTNETVPYVLGFTS